MTTTVQVELQRRNQSGQLIPWTVNDDGSELVSDPAVLAKLEEIATALQSQTGQIFFQATPLQVWTITHAFTYPPNVSIIRSDGTQVWGTVQHIDSNTVQLSFSGAFAGMAYLS